MLKKYFDRPTFYFVVLNTLTEIIKDSKIAEFLKTEKNLKAAVDDYITSSSNQPSHFLYHQEYSATKINKLIVNLK